MTTKTAPLAPDAAPPRVAILDTSRRRAAGLLGVLLLVLLSAAASLAVGSKSVPLADVWTALTAPDGSDATAIVRDLRIPRTLLGLLVGAALGAGGAVMQGVTRNPLAEPGLLGINAGASLAVVLAISVAGVDAVSAYAGVALVGAGITAALVFALGGTGRGGPTPIRLALAGAVLMTLLVSITSAILVFDARTLDEFRFWLVGSIAGRDAAVTAAVAPFVLAGLGLALASGRGLNGLALGDDVARSLGLEVARTRVVASAGFVLLAGGAVAAAGPIAFVGLAVPHLARLLVGPDYRWIVPYALLLGAVVLLGGDVLGRVVARPAELQVGIVTALFGAPFFIWLVRRRKLVAL
ncbi:MAG: iron ABC transporter permease [Patulibacter minatonensis]